MTFLLTGRYAEHTFTGGVPHIYYRRLGSSYPNPVYAAVYAFWYYEQARGTSEFDYFLNYYNIAAPPEPKSGYMTYFYAVADWLVDELTLRQHDSVTFGVWEYDFPWDTYNLKPGWISGMAQGLGIQVLVRAWLDSGDDKYAQALELARRSFRVPTSAGGVTIMDSDAAWWYEEYASPGGLESRVFNGAAHSVIALYELAAATGDIEARALADRGLTSLLASLDAYDAGWWTYYDALGLMSNYKYHHVNINLARHLGEQVHNQQLLTTADYWASYTMPFFRREFIKQRPQVSDMGLLLLSWGLTFIFTTVLATSITPVMESRPIRTVSGER